jgi:hypothetical protein
MPQPPQSVTLVYRSVSHPLSVRGAAGCVQLPQPGAQATVSQSPAWQLATCTFVFWQGRPHAPQLFTSVVKSVHVPPHIVPAQLPPMPLLPPIPPLPLVPPIPPLPLVPRPVVEAPADMPPALPRPVAVPPLAMPPAAVTPPLPEMPPADEMPPAPMPPVS